MLDKITIPAGEMVTLLVQLIPHDPNLMRPNDEVHSKVFFRRGREYWVADSFDVLINNERWTYRLDETLQVPPVALSQTLPGVFKAIRVLEGEK